MSTPNLLASSPPYAVEQALERLGADLRTARIRRGLTIAAVAKRIGTGVRAVSDAERGKPSTAVAVYIALLWAYDLLVQIDPVADPARDAEGRALDRRRQRPRARRSPADDDF